MRAPLRVLAAMVLIAIPGCGSVESQPDAPTTAILTVTTTGDGMVASSPGGIACGSTCAATFDLGTAVTLTATPGATSTFGGWTGACSGTALTCTVTLTGATTVGATFAAAQRTVTIVLTGDGSGTIDSVPAGLVCPGACTLTVDHDTMVTLTPHPALGSTFAGWTGGGCAGVAPCAVRITADVSIQAAFAADHTLVVTRAGSGSGAVTSSPTGIDCGSDCSETYPQGTVVTLTATPDAGSSFAGWSGACSGTGTCTVTMDAAQSVTATFTLGQHTLLVSLAGSGTGTVASSPAGISCGTDCSEDYAYGATVTLTATPAAGSTFAGWSGACSGTGACALSITGLTTVSATFTLNQYTLAVTRAGTGTGTVTSNPAGITCGADCTEAYAYGTAVTLTAAAAVGSTFTGWSGACTGSGVCVVTVTAATAVTATFAINQYTLTVTRAGTGSGSVTSSPAGISCGADCTETYNQGTVVTLTASPAAGSTFAGWSGACSGTGACGVTMDAAQTATANFTLGQYTLTVSRTGTGTGTVASSPAGINCGADCTEDFGFGAAVTLTATPATGSTFAGWSGACTGTGGCSLSITGVTNVTATFTLSQHTLTVTRAGTGSGTVTSSPTGINCGADCTEIYNYGTAVTLTAVAAVGTTFTGWSGACTGTGTCAVTMTAATAVTATFTANQYTLTVSRTGTGAGTVTSSPTGITCGTDCSQAYNYGTSVTLTATASAGSYFAGWSGACAGTGTCTVSMTATQSATARFTLRGSVYAIRDSDDMFQRGNPDTGAIADVGLLGVTYAFGDCAYNSANGVMYMVDGRGAKGLYRVSLTTGAATLVGTHNVTDMFALAFDAGNGLLYGVAANGNLYRMSTTTGAATLIGATGASGTINGLAWDSTRSRLVAITASLASATVYSINVSTGVATTLASSLPGIDNNGWTYDPVIDRLWAVDYGGNIFQYNPTTFARTTFATGQGAHTCMAYVP